METIFQTVKVKNKQILITLPDDFEGDEVDVAISDVISNIEVPQWQKDEVRKRRAKYIENPSIGLNFYDVMKKLKNDL